jgi:hypothetical protein
MIAPSRKKRIKRRPQRRRTPAAPPSPAENGNATAEALLALEDGRGTAEADASVEDPLEDWPEAEGEPDRWLDERPGEGVEKTPDE